MMTQDALDKLLDLIGGDPDSLAELIESFLEESSLLVDQMRRAAASGDSAALGRAAHTLKSSARDFGAMDLAALCEEMEKACRVGGLPDGAVSDVDVIADVATKAQKDLADRLAVLRGGN